MLFLVIICPNPHAQLTKIKLVQVGIGSDIADNHYPSLLGVILGILCHTSQYKLTKGELGQGGICMNIAKFMKYCQLKTQ